MGQPFLKGHGTENDFVLLPDLDDLLDLTPEYVAAVCDRRAGVGGDGALRIVRGRDAAPWFMDYRNGDGSVAEMCGNGIRVVARYLVDEGLAKPGEVAIETRDGVKHLRLGPTGDVTVDMGTASVAAPHEVTVSVGDRHWPATVVDVGNPHAVAYVDDLADAGALRDAPDLDPAFPSGVNVEFIVARGPMHLAMRVHERGVGETRSCGTGACAAAFVASLAGGEKGTATYVVEVPGGRLSVEVHDDGRVALTGPAVIVARGELSDGLLEG